MVTNQNSKSTAIKTVIFVLFAVFQLYPQALSTQTAEKFIELLMKDSPELQKFILPSELSISNRLGISYTEENNKFIVANNFDNAVKADIENKVLNYGYSIEPLENEFSKLTVTIPAKKIQNEYLFYKQQLVSKQFYYCKDWNNRKSKYFNFLVSDTCLISNYSMHRLDSFLEEMLTLLKFNNAEIKKLSDEKIIYYLCRNEDEMEKITGYKAKGLYDLSYDCIVSTYNCHFHEILHLLINYKFKQINLYTLPVLQEGFAVAFGGRGGLEADVLSQTGLYLAKNNFTDINTLLNRENFMQQDASFSYPVSGLYTRFLIKNIGVEKYLQLYKNYSGALDYVNSINILLADLPQDTCWAEYLNNPGLNNYININDINPLDYKPILETANCTVSQDGDSYLFKIKGTLSIASKEKYPGYTSKLFAELFPDKTYDNQKYIIKADSNEVSVYNVLTNNLIAKYVMSFAEGNKPVLQKDGFFIFALKKSLFEEAIDPENIQEL